MDYRARFYSPALKRFIQPDSIIPGAANPQSWNRFSYVGNNPISRTDPSGHICVSEGPGDCLESDGTTGGGFPGGNNSGNSSNNNGGGDPEDPGDPDDDLSVGGGNTSELNMFSSDCFRNVSWGVMCLDFASVLVSVANAVATDVAMIAIIGGGCTTVVGCPVALLAAIKVDFLMANSPVGTLENGLGFVSLFLTAISDTKTGYSFDDTTGMTINIGQDTVVSSKNFLLGLIPEVNIDASVSINQFAYDIGRDTGRIPNQVGYSISIPTPRSIATNVPKMFMNYIKCNSILCPGL